MAVPNTTTFALSDVITEIGPHINSLGGCFADANSSYFNPLYEGDKDRLSNFRDYGAHHGLTLEVTPANETWTYRQIDTRVFTVNISPDTTFTIFESGDTSRFTVTSNQTLNTISVTPISSNLSGSDYFMELTISATGYPSDSIECWHAAA